MKLLKKILIGLLVLLVLLLILSFILPKEWAVEKTRVIKAPSSHLYAIVNDLKTHQSWSPWKAKDSTMVMAFSDPSIGKDAFYTWDSQSSGTGKYTITESNYGSGITSLLDFGGKGQGEGTWKFEDSKKGTKISWNFASSSKWPMNLMNFMGKRVVGKTHKQGLELLENYALSQIDTKLAQFEVKKVAFPYNNFIAKRQKVGFDGISNYYQENLRSIYDFLLSEKAEIAGEPCGLFFDWNEEEMMTDMAAAIPTKDKITGSGFSNIELNKKNAYLIEHYGPLEQTGAAHEVMELYFFKNNIKAGIPAIEQYVTDPSTVSNPNEMLTKIYYFLEK